MLRLSLALCTLTMSVPGVTAAAQIDGCAVAPEPEPAPGQPLNRSHITSTGQTVPRPGLPQSSGVSPLDRSMQRQDDQIDNSICKGC